MTESTYPFVTRVRAFCPLLSSYPEGTLTVPVPFGESVKSPFESVVEIVFPLTFTLSTSRSPVTSTPPVTAKFVPSKVKLPSSSSSPEVPAITTLLFVKSDTFAVDIVVEPTLSDPLISALPFTSRVVVVISTSVSAAIANTPSLGEETLSAESLNCKALELFSLSAVSAT